MPLGRLSAFALMRFATLAASVALATPVYAGAYRIDLAVPRSGKLLRGHAGVEAVDDRTDTALVRIVAPGNDIHDVGTVRVLVMNLSNKAFEVGPDEVTLSLADGTVLKPVSIAKFEDGREYVETETRHAEANDLSNRNSVAELASQQNSGETVQSLSPGAPPPGSSTSTVQGRDRRADEPQLPGEQMLQDIYQLLIPLSVEPQKAWGGYYVFEMPKAVFARKADQPLTIAVRTGAEEHRFAATLKWK